MNRNTIIGLIVGAIILVLAICWFSGTFDKTPAVAKTENGKAVITADPCAEQNRTIQDLMTQIADLRADTARLSAELACLNKGTKKTYTAPKKSATPATTTSTQKQAAAPVTTPTPPSTAKLKSGTPGIANLDYLRQGGEIIFCVRANGREDCYFPHYAMNQGVMFSKSPTDNQVKGYNWKVEPTDFYDGDYGVTIDGTFYVSKELVEKSLQAGGLLYNGQIEIKCPYTGWALKTMQTEDGYFIFRTQK